MKVKGLIINFLHVSFLVLGIFQASVNGRPLLLSLDRPRPDDAADFARWLVCQNSWGVLSTISNDWGGAPFGNVVSFSDGIPDEGKGIPYFYLTALDPTASNALKDQRSSLTLSEYNLGTCGKKDPENPTCAKITLIGKLKLLDGDSEETEFARTALFSKHSEMKGWPKSHKFQIFKLDIEDIFLINWYGGPKPLTVDQYLHTKMNELIFNADTSS
ncbi:CREG1 [Olea europaea subsp. europaea]|uniref:CREG1 n=2 Tax=Olea europaea subsp. europaea TaxID=158383 RepID=A0A8S0VL89_OLEEU|nr:CREG1 [Olea europaea subsp. europaea]